MRKSCTSTRQRGCEIDWRCKDIEPPSPVSRACLVPCLGAGHAHTTRNLLAVKLAWIVRTAACWNVARGLDRWQHSTQAVWIRTGKVANIINPPARRVYHHRRDWLPEVSPLPKVAGHTTPGTQQRRPDGRWQCAWRDGPRLEGGRTRLASFKSSTSPPKTSVFRASLKDQLFIQLLPSGAVIIKSLRQQSTKDPARSCVTLRSNVPVSCAARASRVYCTVAPPYSTIQQWRSYPSQSSQLNQGLAPVLNLGQSLEKVFA
jgi:hypothetical protein